MLSSGDSHTKSVFTSHLGWRRVWRQDWRQTTRENKKKHFFVSFKQTDSVSSLPSRKITVTKTGNLLSKERREEWAMDLFASTEEEPRLKTSTKLGKSHTRTHSQIQERLILNRLPLIHSMTDWHVPHFFWQHNAIVSQEVKRAQPKGSTIAYLTHSRLNHPL